MEIEDFRNKIINDIHISASENKSSPQEEFLLYFTDKLIESEEFEDFNLLEYEGVGQKNRKILISGYDYSELDNCYSIVTCIFSDSKKLENLSKSVANIYFSRAEAFVEDSISGFLQKNAEESSPGYSLAIDIQNKATTTTKYKFYILTDMQMSRRIDNLENVEIYNTITERHIWDIHRLLSIEESKFGKEDIVIDLTKFMKDGLPYIKACSNDEYTAYTCNISGMALAEIYNKFGSRLLEGNVRSFLSVKGKINKGIRNTILNKPLMFFAYNNGIAATASNVEIVHNTFGTFITKIKSLQIVNGGQTTVSLATVLNNDKQKSNNLNEISVLMKLSVVSPEKAEELIPNIARYANSQNKVNDSDFFSNHNFHIQMETLSRRVIAPAIGGNQYGTYWYYERTRGQYQQELNRMKKGSSASNNFLKKNPKNQKFTKTDLAKYHNIYLKLPHCVCTGAQKNFAEFAKWITNKWDQDPDFFNSMYFKQIIAIFILYRNTDIIIRNSSWYDHGYKSQICAYTLSYLFYLIEKKYQNYEFNFNEVWLKQDISHETKIALSEISEIMFSFLTSSDREIENVTEWAKRPACWYKAKNIEVNLSDKFLNELISKSDFKNELLDARKDQKLDNSANLMIQVANYGADKWKKLLEWGISTNIFNAQEISLLRTAIAMEKGKFPSEKQCFRIINILDKSREEGWPN